MEEQLNAGIHTKSGKSLMNAFLRARTAFGFEYLTRNFQKFLSDDDNESLEYNPPLPPPLDSTYKDP